MANLNELQDFGVEEFSLDQIEQVDKIISENRGRPGCLIPVLEQIQEILGYLPIGIQNRVAKGLNIPVANVYGVVSFYSFFTMVPRGRHNIRVCLGTACYVRGSKRILERLIGSLGIEPGGCTEDRRFSLETVRCLGACGLAPVMVVDKDTYGRMNVQKIEAILDKYE
ncbi:MAG: NAD(P)H-dependent oxidoreductase subunit E [Deltaproteobacteria bacterium]|nr:NAD(P)H-dependent oxidoreductase subunit E [Deltaproteobacteria bacterium]